MPAMRCRGSSVRSARFPVSSACGFPPSRSTTSTRSGSIRAASHRACLAGWHEKIGADDLVLVDRPGRGYGDDYSPWLVDAPVGEFVPVCGAAVSEEGILAA